MTEGKHYRYLEFRFDQGRLDRSNDVTIVSVDEEGRILGDGEYLAIGRSLHYLTTRPFLDCDCNDFAWGPDRLCKHLIAALRSEEDEVLELCIQSAKVKPTITLVAGPPGAGKSYYVGLHAKDSDLIWDYDLMASAITVHPKNRGRSVSKRDIVRALRDAYMRKLKDMVDKGTLADDVWIIWTMPSAKARGRLVSTLGAKVVIVETPALQCMSRGRDQRGVESWWAQYEQRSGETIVK